MSGVNKEHVIGNWREGYPCYQLTKNLAVLCSTPLWKVELADDQRKKLTEAISKQNIEGMASFLHEAYGKM